MNRVHLDMDGAVAELRLDNPDKLNALTASMLEDLERHCETVETNPDVRAVLLTSSGDRAFCVGADVNEWADLDPRTFAREWIRRGHRIFDRLAALPVPVIGVLSGHAFGGGLELAAACDLRAMIPDATIALPETGIGIVPGWSGTQRLMRQIPSAILNEMALTGARISAKRAYQVGFVNVVADDAKSAALDLAQSVITKGPQATETAKWMIASNGAEASAASIEALAGAAMAASTEKVEGVASFREKRVPNFGSSR